MFLLSPQKFKPHENDINFTVEARRLHNNNYANLEEFVKKELLHYPVQERKEAIIFA